MPDLVIEGELCPHRDYVHFTLPTEQENQSIVEFRQNIETLFHKIENDETIIKALINIPFGKIQRNNWIGFIIIFPITQLA